MGPQRWFCSQPSFYGWRRCGLERKCLTKGHTVNSLAELSGNLSRGSFHLLPFLPPDKQMPLVLLTCSFILLAFNSTANRGSEIWIAITQWMDNSTWTDINLKSTGFKWSALFWIEPGPSGKWWKQIFFSERFYFFWLWKKIRILIVGTGKYKLFKISITYYPTIEK